MTRFFPSGGIFPTTGARADAYAALRARLKHDRTPLGLGRFN